MLKPTTTDPGLITLSTNTYRLLLAFYPTRFRREYGPHMAQVFRDCCLKTYRKSGLTGMLALWSLTLFDWFKTVVEEQVFREVEMTRTKLIRLSGWGMMVSPISLFIGLGDPVQYRLLFYNLFGAPADRSSFNTVQYVTEKVPIFLVFIGLIFILFGFLGFYSRYHERFGGLGRLSLRLCVISSGVTALGGTLSFTSLDLWWYVFLVGFLFTFVCLALFGVITFREKPLPRWNALPLFTGVWFPGTLIIGLSLGWDENPYFLILPMLISLLGLIGLGHILQADAGREEKGDK